MEIGTTEAPAWTEEIRIRSYDVDASRRATSLSLFRYFLEAAWNHAEALGIGFTALREQGKFWVLSRLRVEVETYPDWGSTCVLKTWPRGIDSVFALRDFEFLDAAGVKFAAGSSAWLVVDSNSKRPQRLHKLMPNFASLHGKSALGREPEKLEAIHHTDSSSEITVRYTDMDVNQHVNSARYLGWIVDSYPAGFHLQHALAVLEANYLTETREGEQLIIQTDQLDAAQYTHSIIKPNGPEVLRARLGWKATL